MSRPRALFQVDEEAINMSVAPSVKATVLVIDYCVDNEAVNLDGIDCVAHEGWYYQMSNDLYFTHESDLRKIPPLAKWEDCEWQHTLDSKMTDNRYTTSTGAT